MSIGVLNLKEIVTAFMVLFAIIDITGSVPVILELKERNGKVEAGKAALISFAMLVVFLFMGEAVLRFFNVDIPSFAIAGAIVLIAVAIEMTFNVTLFKSDASQESGTIVPLVFPLIAGAGSLTTCLSLRAECSAINIIIAIALNMAVVYFVIKKVNWVEKLLGKGGIYILRKMFGVILLAMSVKLIVTNLSLLLN
ncbi:MAG: MarC family protein [Candidatus Onthomorpha sp.]